PRAGGGAGGALALPLRPGRLGGPGASARRAPPARGGALGPGKFVGIGDDQGAPRRPRHVQPEVVGLGHAEGELVVLGIALADEDREAVVLDRAVSLALAAHAPRRAPRSTPARGGRRDAPLWCYSGSPSYPKDP